ncbi:hypothetical protein GCM10025868_39360 [Angustibacter aerolatus]|uniref:DhaL domain-containing protein n=1 Tax=Angustibacter aerolatus TaxID=1162965 RepID=A0ABQ6JPT9_9ACTN|nr:hypothetical protein [Angustibacter aerolatus]GMA88686.1 hypothetical protein GCM10025868_39360 [Angustibacter aerolatus]
MLEEGAQLLERAAGARDRSTAHAQVLRDAATGLRDTSRPAQARLAAGTSAAVHAGLDEPAGARDGEPLGRACRSRCSARWR